MPALHYEGDVQRNYTAYNFQTLRDDVYMLAHDGDVTGNRIGPARSSCAVHVSSYNNNRDTIYIQQQTISTVVSKPVRRLEMIWGRMIGYMALVTVLGTGADIPVTSLEKATLSLPLASTALRAR